MGTPRADGDRTHIWKGRSMLHVVTRAHSAMFPHGPEEYEIRPGQDMRATGIRTVMDDDGLPWTVGFTDVPCARPGAVPVAWRGTTAPEPGAVTDTSAWDTNTVRVCAAEAALAALEEQVLRHWRQDRPTGDASVSDYDVLLTALRAALRAARAA